MEEHNILIIANRREFRAWFEAHHANERECWVEVKRGRPVDDQHFWYLDAVEEALCFGWIDSRHKLIDGKPNVEKMNLITFDPVHHTYIQLGKAIGNAFADGKQLK